VASAAHESDFAVAQLEQVAQAEFRTAALIERNVRDPLDFAMASTATTGRLMLWSSTVSTRMNPRRTYP